MRGARDLLEARGEILGLSLLTARHVFKKLAAIRGADSTIPVVEQNAIALEIETRRACCRIGRVVLTGSRETLEASDFVRHAYHGV
jgi:ABC-type branched-subunit amino acid transport system ATPase component